MTSHPPPASPGNRRPARPGLGRCARIAATLLTAVLGGCAQLSSPGQVSLPEPPKQAELTPTQREHQRILASYGGTYADTRAEGLINQVVARLVAASERPDLRYRVIVLNSPAVNAFALPDGQLYVSRGMLALANDTSELASVLAHEMAHVIARHASIRENQARKAELISRVATDVFNDPQMSALTVAKSKIALAGFSRAQEFEADAIGVGISSRAGFDPYGSVRFLTAMGRNASLRPTGGLEADPRFVDFLSSHPATPDRIRNARANARQFAAPGPGERDGSHYLTAIDGLIYGEDPSEGYVRGRRFLHPKLGFTFLAPPGFVLDNTAQAVLGVREGGAEALRLDVVRVPGVQGLSDYLRSGWIENVDPQSVENFSVNGFAAATAVARGQEWTFRLYAVRFGSEVYRFIFATKSRSDAADQRFRASIESFRRMTVDEIQSAKPLRIKIATAAVGDTPERLARRMSVDHPLERFLVLNGLERGQALKPGDRVKIVIE